MRSDLGRDDSGRRALMNRCESEVFGDTRSLMPSGFENELSVGDIAIWFSS